MAVQQGTAFDNPNTPLPNQVAARTPSPQVPSSPSIVQNPTPSYVSNGFGADGQYRIDGLTKEEALQAAYDQAVTQAKAQGLTDIGMINSRGQQAASLARYHWNTQYESQSQQRIPALAAGKQDGEQLITGGPTSPWLGNDAVVNAELIQASKQTPGIYRLTTGETIVTTQGTQVGMTQQGQIPGGEQLIIQEDHARSAGELIAKLQDKPFNPGRLMGDAGASILEKNAPESPGLSVEPNFSALTGEQKKYTYTFTQNETPAASSVTGALSSADEFESNAIKTVGENYWSIAKAFPPGAVVLAPVELTYLGAKGLQWTGQQFQTIGALEENSNVPFIEEDPILRTAKNIQAMDFNLIGGGLESTGSRIIEKPVTTSGEVLVSYGIGATIGAADAVLGRAATSLQESKYAWEIGAGNVIAGTKTVAGYALGATYAYEVGTKVVGAPNDAVRGAIVVEEGINFGAMTQGVEPGQRLGNGIIDYSIARYDQARGWLYTRAYEKRYAGQLVTIENSRELALPPGTGLQTEIEVQPILRDVSESVTMQSQARSLQASSAKRIYGEPTTINGADLPKPSDEFLATTYSLKESGKVTGNAKLAAPNSPETNGLPSTEVRGAVFDLNAPEVSRTASITTADEIAKKNLGSTRAGDKEQNLFVINEGPGNGAKGTVEFERTKRVTIYEQYAEPGRGVTTTGTKSAHTTQDLKRLGFEFKKLETTFSAPGQIENLRPYNEATGDFFTLDEQTGEFSLVRHTEARRFQRGSGEIPGRAQVTKGTLPDAAYTNKNLPIELAKEFKNTPAGRKFLEGQGLSTGKPLIIKSVKVKPAPRNTISPSNDLPPGATMTSEGQVLIQEPKVEVTAQALAATVTEEATTKAQESATAQATTTQQEPVISFRSEPRTRFDSVKEASLRKGRFVSLSQARSLQRGRVLSVNVEQSSRVAQQQGTRQATQAGFASLQRTSFDVSQAQRPTQDVAQAQDFARPRESRVTFDVPTIGERVAIDTPPEKTTPFGQVSWRNRQNGTGKFDVFVRFKGKFVQVNNQALSAEEALAKGKQVVLNTAAASFKVEPVNSNTANIDVIANRELSPNTFTRSKRDHNIFVQKAASRITSIGEKAEITFKGIAASRNKKRLWRR